jgi:hypothetical protein
MRKRVAWGMKGPFLKSGIAGRLYNTRGNRDTRRDIAQPLFT